MQVKIEIKNMDKIIRALNKSPIIVSKYIQVAIQRSIYTIQRSAQPLTPVDTGRLRQSYQSTFMPLRGVLEPMTNYAYYVHDGTSRMHGRPFLQEGMDKAMRDVNKEFEIGLEKALSEVARQSK